ncbi:MAG: hypothetical protein IMZ44_10040 [Planctomycetes bacterium]|nr:hypothetical protein [Planctomycetota bacterium]
MDLLQIFVEKGILVAFDVRGQLQSVLLVNFPVDVAEKLTDHVLAFPAPFIVLASHGGNLSPQYPSALFYKHLRLLSAPLFAAITVEVFQPERTAFAPEYVIWLS